MATEVARKALEDASADNGENADKFRADPRYTFRHVYFNPKRHGEDAAATIEAFACSFRRSTAETRNRETPRNRCSDITNVSSCRR